MKGQGLAPVTDGEEVLPCEGEKGGGGGQKDRAKSLATSGRLGQLQTGGRGAEREHPSSSWKGQSPLVENGVSDPTKKKQRRGSASERGGAGFRGTDRVCPKRLSDRKVHEKELVRIRK